MSKLGLDVMLDVGIEAACIAGRILVEERQKGPLDVRFKGAIDPVTQADERSEAAIAETLLGAFPDHGLLAEEEGSRGRREAGVTWIVDPLDGTVNYAHGYPCYCVSVAAYTGDTPLLGLVLDVPARTLYMAASGQGAWRQGELDLARPPRATEVLDQGIRLTVSSIDRIDRSMVATGFPYWLHDRPEQLLEFFGRVARSAQALRRDGAAALDLCRVAEGSFDGFWEFGLKPWDVAAGALIVAEAGGRVSQLDGSPLDLAGERILVSNGLIHEQLVDLLTD